MVTSWLRLITNLGTMHHCIAFSELSATFDISMRLRNCYRSSFNTTLRAVCCVKCFKCLVREQRNVLAISFTGRTSTGHAKPLSSFRIGPVPPILFVVKTSGCTRRRLRIKHVGKPTSTSKSACYLPTDVFFFLMSANK